jgi:hypothetical protein
MRRTAWLCAVLACVLVGCDGNDTGDAGPDGGREDAGDSEVIVPSCAGAEDGTPCPGGMICIDEACVASECGDGFVHIAAGEDCEDGNDVAFDGCEPTTCTFTCDDALEDCDDGFVCNGAELCTAHVCAPGTAATDGTPCSTTEVPDGVCHPLPTPICQVAECGNGMRDTDEECDDGRNGDASDGCGDDCRFACASTTEGCQLVIIPDFHDFGSLEEGMTAERSFMLQNLGDATTGDVPAITIEGLDASEYAVDLGSCTVFITAGGTCMFTVRFTPSGAGMRQAMIVATAGAGFAGAAEVRGVALGALGTACTGDAACAGGHCTDGVCCGVAAADCTGCYACDVAGSEGTCAPVLAGDDPHMACDGACEDACDGAGACRPAAQGTVCLTEPCSNTMPGTRQWQGVSNGTHVCDGASTECPTRTAFCAGGFTCDTTTGACRTTCADDSQCVLGSYCSGGSCVSSTASNGAPCTRDAQCQWYAYCVGGTCRECASNRDCARGSYGAGLREVCASDGECDDCYSATNGTCGGLGSSCSSLGGCVGCNSNADCQWDTAPNCVPSGDSQVPGNVCSCSTNRFGTCAPWQVCVSGQCKTRSGNTCLVSSECASSNCLGDRCS